jgi:Tfp pilus assembly PilM family ATPase
MVESIAFGADVTKTAACLGLYLGPDVVYLAETHTSGGKVVVDHLVRIPIPSDGKGLAATATMNTDFLANPAKIAGLIRQSMSQLRWNTKNVRVTLSHHLGLLRYFAMPMMDRRFLRSAVPLEAKKYIPIPFDILAHDFQAAPLSSDAGGKPRVGVLIAVTQKKNIANVQGLLDTLGLKLNGLEVAPCSSLRLWQAIDPPKDASSFAHVHIDNGNVRVMVIDRGVPVFFREVFLGEDAGLASMRKIDLSGCLSFVQKQLGLTNIGRLRVSGNINNLAGLTDAFASETGLKSTIQDTPRLLSIKSGDWGGYAALGASMLGSAGDVPPLNLAATGRVTDEERQTARDVLLLGAAASVFFAGAGLLKSATYTYRAQELHKYEARLAPDVRAEIGNMDPAAITAMLGDMQKQLNQLHAVTAGSQRLRASVVLKQIIEAMPDKLWFDSINVTNALHGNEVPFSISLTGHVQDKSVSDEQALAFNFKEALLRNPMLGKVFEISLSVQRSGDDDDTGTAAPGLDPKGLSDRLEKRTQFQLVLKGKK